MSLQLPTIVKKYRSNIAEQKKLINEMDPSINTEREISYEKARLQLFETRLKLWVLNTTIKAGRERKIKREMRRRKAKLIA